MKRVDKALEIKDLSVTDENIEALMDNYCPGEYIKGEPTESTPECDPKVSCETCWNQPIAAEYHVGNLCDTCTYTVPTCGAQCVFGIDLKVKLKEEALNDAVVGCNNYERREDE